MTTTYLTAVTLAAATLLVSCGSQPSPRATDTVTQLAPAIAPAAQTTTLAPREENRMADIACKKLEAGYTPSQIVDMLDAEHPGLTREYLQQIVQEAVDVQCKPSQFRPFG
jgi:hypothetical protein